MRYSPGGSRECWRSSFALGELVGAVTRMGFCQTCCLPFTRLKPVAQRCSDQFFAGHAAIDVDLQCHAVVLLRDVRDAQLLFTEQRDFNQSSWQVAARLSTHPW